MGAIFYIVMDIAVHYGVLRHLRKDVGANGVVLILAISLDLTVLAGLIWLEWQTDFIVVWISLAGILALFVIEFFLRRVREANVT